jgi:predicted CXXCH cytochrome family protein
MPLDSRARITCLTCHEAPESSDSPDHADLGLKRSLQRPSGIEFCAKCHTKMGGTLLEVSHWRSSARAHLGSINPQSERFQTFEQRIGGIDAESRACLSCHDNISVTIPLPNETARQKQERRKTMSDHPIGMDYQYAALRKNRRYNSLLTDQQIRLFDGRLGCGSCHSPYSQLKDNLVMPNIRGALCRRCHNM